MNLFAKSTGIVFLMALGRGLVILAGLVTIRVATVLMTPSQYGAISQMLSLASLALALLVTPVYMYFSRRQLEWADTGDLTAAMRKTLTILCVIAVSVAIAGGAAQYLFGALQISGFTPAAFASALFAFLLLNGAQLIGAQGLISFGYRKAYVLLNVLVAWLSLILAVAGFKLFGGPSAWMIGVFLGYGVGLVSYGLLWREAVRVPHIGRDAGARMEYGALLLFGWPQAICYLMLWLQTQSFRFITAGLGGLGTVGILTSGYSLCATAMTAFESLFNDIYMPGMLRNLKFTNPTEASAVWSEYAVALVPAIICFGGFLTFAAPYAAFVFLGARFHTVAMVVPLFALAETMRAVSFQAVAQLGLARADLKLTIAPAAVGGIVATIAIGLLAPRDPMWGTAAGILISYVFMFGFCLRLVYVLGAKWPFRRALKALALAAPFSVAIWLFPPSEGLGLLRLVAMPTLAGIYLCAVEFFIARHWLHRVAGSLPA